MATLDELTQLVLKFREERNWAQFHNPKDVALSLTLEAEELAAHLKANREALGDELSDILGWVLVFAKDQGIDLEQAFRRKLEKNAEKYPVEKARGVAKKYTEL
jgi:NTP pyrophosphatase (non-canonical NTP hydrolase)